MDCSEDFSLSSLGAEVQEKFSSLIKDITDAYDEDPQICVRLLRYLLNKYDIRCRSDDKTEDKSIQTDQTENEVCPWKSTNIVDEVTSIAEATVSQTGFVFDRNTGSYYNQSEQCYYIPDYKLYYYVKNKAYYYYDESEKSMKFHSSVDVNDEPEPEPPEEVVIVSPKSPRSPRSPRKRKKRSRSRREEGECSSDDGRRHRTSRRKKSRRSEKSRSRSKKYDKEHCAPCIRLIVKETSLKNLPIGKLFVVTRTGGTLGREGEHDVLIPDLNVSKEHLTFRYVRKKGKYFYELTDLGSKNGTYLNGNRMSEPKEKSEPFELCHSDEITLGCTILLCHIHDDQTTCQDCEPSYYGFSPESENIVSYNKTSSKSLREQHRDEMRQIKKKFGLAPVANVKLAKGYEDKAEIRRKKVGSSHSSEKTEVASTDIPLNKKNKGFSMLSKMGWKEGEGVGKASEGIKAPIDVKSQNGKLGLGAPDLEFALPPPPVKTNRSLEALKKVQKRYLDIFEEENKNNVSQS